MLFSLYYYSRKASAPQMVWHLLSFTNKYQKMFIIQQLTVGFVKLKTVADLNLHVFYKLLIKLLIFILILRIFSFKVSPIVRWFHITTSYI